MAPSKRKRSPNRRSTTSRDSLKAAKAVFAADQKARKASESPLNRSEAFDYFSNVLARTGYGTASLPEATEYNLERLSNNYFLMLTLYRNHWIARRIVDLPAIDMTRSWPRMQCDRSPQDLEKFKKRITRSYTPSAIRTAIKWARLYGGAGGLITIKGHEDILDEPLDLDDVNPGSFLGVIPFDRWVGIYPRGMVKDDAGHPADWGLPEHYEVRGPNSSKSFTIHASRILRFTGAQVPTPELQAQIYWGISWLEVVWEELKKRDNASFAILNLLFRANLLAQVNPELAQMLSGLGSNQTALKNFWSRMQAQNEILSNQSMMILGKDSSLQQVQYSFSGMDGLYGMFQMDVAGAAEIPVTRLFGRTVTGLGQSNDADERYYEEMIAARQHEELQPQLDKLYPIVAMSEFGEVPDDMDISFPSVRVLTEEEKADLLEKASAPILAAYNAGLISQKSALKDLRQVGDLVGTAFTNITDEDIQNADAEPIMPGGEEEPPEPEAGGGEEHSEESKKKEEEGEPAKKGPVEQAAKRMGNLSPSRLLRRASGGAEDNSSNFKESEHPRDKFSEKGEIKSESGLGDKVEKPSYKCPVCGRPNYYSSSEGFRPFCSLECMRKAATQSKDTSSYVGKRDSARETAPTALGQLQKLVLEAVERRKEGKDAWKASNREWHGLPVKIETKAGETRSGKDAGGRPWSIKMSHDYGELHGTNGVDGDPVDVFLGPDGDAEYVYVVHTMAPPEFEEYDEDKAFLNFPSEAVARKAFYDNYTRPEFFGSMERFPVEKFLDKVKSTKRKGKPISIVVDAAAKIQPGVEKEKRPWIGCDLDSTLALPVEGDFDPLKIGPPNPTVVERVKKALQKGWTVKILTARLSVEEPLRTRIQKAIEDWTLENVGTRLESTNEKDSDLVEIWDDRARPII